MTIILAMRNSHSKDINDIKKSKPSDEDFIRLIHEQLPEFETLLKEHQESNDEILPHIFFIDMTAEVSKLSKENTTGKNEKLLSKVANFIEYTLNRNNLYLENLVEVSFLESLGPKDESFTIMKRFFGPETMKKAILLEKAWGINNE